MSVLENKEVEPSRLVVARFARAKSRVNLANEVRISPSYYAEMEIGTKSAKKHIRYIADALCFPLSFFFLDPVTIPSGESFLYRCKSSMKSTNRFQIQGIGTIYACNLAKLIKKYVRVPDVDTPDLSGLIETESAFEVGEAGATVIREKFSIGNAPLRSAIDLVEATGILVFWVDGPSEFDGVSFWVSGRPFLLINKNSTDGFRIRFTILHELGHILFHRHIHEFGKFHDKQADSFASAMLMPMATFKRCAPRRVDLSRLLEDRSVWGASVHAQVRRMYDLKLIHEWAYRDAHIRMNRSWGQFEPDAVHSEESKIHKFLFDEAGDYGTSPFDLAEEAHIPYDQFLDAFPIAKQLEPLKLKIF